VQVNPKKAKLEGFNKENVSPERFLCKLARPV